MKLLYTTKAIARGGRDGTAETIDGRLKVNLSIPKELGGPGTPGATNPEQLFAAGYSACFESAIRHVARLRKIVLSDLHVEAEVSLKAVELGFGLVVSLGVYSEAMGPELRELVVKAHEVCPYSNAIRGNVDVTITVNNVSL